MHLPHCSLKLFVYKGSKSVFYLLEFRFTSCKEAELKLPSTSQTTCFRGKNLKGVPHQGRKHALTPVGTSPLPAVSFISEAVSS